MQLSAVIQKFGLTPKEAAVYLAALELGGSRTYEIAKKLRMARTSCSDAVSTLCKKGLLNFYKLRGQKIYSAENPEKFASLLKDQGALLEDVLPQLRALHRADKGGDRRPVIRFYEGAEGCRVIFEDILDFGHNVLAVTSLDDALEVLGDDFSGFIERRQRRKLRVRLLTKRTPLAERLKKIDAQELRQTVFLPDGYDLKTANFIYGDRLAILSLNRTRPTGLVIEDAGIADTHRMFFEFAWHGSGRS